MRNYMNRFLLVLTIALGLIVPVRAKEGPQGKTPHTTFNKGSVGSCTVGNAAEYLDINNVKGRIFNTGGLFFKDTDEYYVPKAALKKPLFASGIWIGGKVSDELRVAGTQYRNWEFWPGPLNDDGSAPADCSLYDDIYKVSKDDISAYERGGAPTNDLANWPYQLGAPVFNGDGIVGNYDLAGGDRPAFPGQNAQGKGGADQMLWWVMNDVGNQHNASATPPIGLEVRVTAFAFRQAGDVGNMTFYKYDMTYKGTSPFDDVYMSIFSDPDLGDAGDDYIGADTTLGLGFVWNADNADGSGAAPSYGTPPPALGYDFFQGPIVDKDGDGDLDTLKMTSFVYFNNCSTAHCDPTTGEERYNYQRARIRDGSQFTIGGNGVGGTVPTSFVYPGAITSPGTFWSENCSVAGTCTPIAPNDRRFVMTTGPFRILPGQTQSIVYGIVFAQGSNNIDSVAKLKLADRKAQRLFDVNFSTAPTPDVPVVSISTVDGDANITWTNPTSSNNYLESYVEVDPQVLPGVGLSDTYVFEGYVVRQYDNPAQSSEDAAIVKVFDVDNLVGDVYDNGSDPNTLIKTFAGTNSGISNNFTVTGLTNYKSYYFTVQACAYNVDSVPKIYCSAESDLVEYVPTRASGSAIMAGVTTSTELDVTYGGTKQTPPNQNIIITVADPLKVTGDKYEVIFKDYEYAPGNKVLTFDIVNVTKNMVVFNGVDAVNQLGGNSPVKELNTLDSGLIIDGLSFKIAVPLYGFTVFSDHPETDHGVNIPLGRPLQREEIATKVARTYNDNGSINTLGSLPGAGTVIRYYGSTGGAVGQVSETDAQFLTVDFSGDGTLSAADKRPAITLYKAAGGANPCIDTPTDLGCKTTASKPWSEKLIFNNKDATGSFGVLGWAAWTASLSGAATALGKFKRTFEIRFTASPSTGQFYFDHGESAQIPFEVWDIGKVGPGEVNNVSDDVQMVGLFFSGVSGTPGFYDGASPVTTTQPTPPTPPVALHPLEGFFRYDRMYAYYPTDYDASNNTIDVNGDGTLDTSPADYAFWTRTTSNTFVEAGDKYEINTASIKPKTITSDEVLAGIGVVPNPYRGASDYEIAAQTDEVRFTNLPKECTIRIFTVSGTLVKTLTKNDTSTYLKYDLSNDSDLRIASGMYIVHVDVPGVGEKVLKLGVVRKRVQLNTF